MKLRNFLDAAYALLVEEYLRIGVNLMEAIDKTLEYRSGKEPEVALEKSEGAQNEASLARLNALMAGVS